MQRLWSVAIASTLIGCGVTDVNLNDPLSPLHGGGGDDGVSAVDSDDDGWSDSEELESFTDPENPLDHPYIGGWPIGSCRHDVESDGIYTTGGIIDNLVFNDQFGDQVKIHDFCEMAIVAVGAAGW